jgi:hypothetical protein
MALPILTPGDLGVVTRFDHVRLAGTNLQDVAVVMGHPYSAPS